MRFRPLAVAVLVFGIAAAIGAFFLLRGDGGASAPRPSPPRADRDGAAVDAADEPAARQETPAAAPDLAASAAPALAPAVPVAPPGRAAVELLASGTREPVAGLRVIFDREPFGPGAPAHRDTSDGAGRIALEGLPVGRWHARADDDFLFVHPQRGFVDVLFDLEPWPTVLTVVRGALVQGSVVDRRGEPVAGADVRLRFDWPSIEDPAIENRDPGLFRRFDEEKLAAVTAADGRFAVRGVPSGVAYSIEAAREGFAPHVVPRLEVPASETITVPPIVLGEGGALRVRASAGDASPVAGAAVRVARLDEPEADPRWPDATEPPAGTSGADGAALVPRLRAGSYAVSVIAPGLRPFTRRDVEIADERTTEIAAALEPGLTLRGVVLDATGAPLPGASVEARRSVVWEKATTGADGRFAIEGLEPPAVRVVATASGFASQRMSVDLIPEDVRIALRREASASGRVVDRDGKPVAHYRLIVEPKEEDLFSSEGQATRQSLDVGDPEGRFRVGSLVPGAYRFRADAPGRGLGSGESEVVTVADGASVEGIRIEVAPTARVRARVADAGTREPLAGATIEWTKTPPSGAATRENRAGIEWNRPRGRANTTSEDGTLDVDVPLTAAALRFSRRGCLESIVEPVPAAAAAGVVELDVFLSRGGAVAGTVRDAAGAPVVAATVVVSNESGYGPEARTDSAGAYSVSGLVPGDYFVGLKRARDLEGFLEYVPATIVADETVRVDFGPGQRRGGSRVHGSVLSSGAPVKNAEVRMRPTGEGGDGGDGPDLGTRADDDGVFEFPCVPAGKWSVAAESETSSVVETVLVDGASPLAVTLVFPGGRLAVTVLDAVSGAPVPGISVVVTCGAGRSCHDPTGPDGRVEFAELEAGPATVRVGGSGWWGGRDLPAYAPQAVETTVPESGAASVEVRLALGAALEGRVTGPDGKAVRNPAVSIHGGGAAAFSSEYPIARSTGDYRMQVDGRYRVEGLAPGTYAAVVRAPGAPILIVPNVRVESPGPSVADFALPRGGTAIVRVVDGRGEAIHPASISVRMPLAGGDEIIVDEFYSKDPDDVASFLLAPGEYVFSSLSYRAVAEEPVRAAATVVAGESTVVTLAQP